MSQLHGNTASRETANVEHRRAFAARAGAGYPELAPDVPADQEPRGWGVMHGVLCADTREFDTEQLRNLASDVWNEALLRHVAEMGSLDRH